MTDPVKTWLLESSRYQATVTLTQKCGVWFVTDASGCLTLHDFTSLKGWGDTDVAVLRAARNLGLSIASQRFVKRTPKIKYRKKVY